MAGNFETYFSKVVETNPKKEALVKGADKMIAMASVDVEREKVKAAKEIKKTTDEYLRKAMPDANVIANDYISMDKRVSESRNNIIMYSMLSKAGIQGANTSLAQETEKYNTLVYFRDKIKDDPKGVS